MQDVFLSVVIPFYNSKHTAKRSIESVVSEIESLYRDRTFVNRFGLEDKVSEIICCDDGSTDGSAEYLDSISYKDFAGGKADFIQIKVMHLKNGGAASARNKGLKYCRGEYIAFNDSDDMWMEGSLKKRLDVMAEEPDAACITANHEYEAQRLPKLNKARSHVHLFYVTLKDELFKNYYTTQNSILRRRVIDDGIYFKEGMRYSEEVYFFFQIVNRYKCLFLNEKMSKSILSKERYGQSGLSGNLWQMEKGELKSISLACREFEVSPALYLASCVYSLAKYVRRVILVALRKRRK